MSDLAGKLSEDIVGEVNILTKEGTIICLPAAGEAGNCAMEEATGKLGPCKEKFITITMSFVRSQNFLPITKLLDLQHTFVKHP